ncbi:carboxylesterase 3-like isoform X2 [Asterias amurensis]|uniref:carboxylesterase 3-like isoform X2 n=1 Tax=Asterias amurensis TaxID=7602 RepID=UPI003AB85B31
MAGYVTNLPSSAVLFVVSCLMLSFSLEKVQSDVVMINTTTGMLSGVSDDTSGSLFLGIPYAEPPIGSLRFRAPVPKIPWEGARAADKHGASCPQDMQSNPDLQALPEEARVVNEDCLTLNVYSPAGAVSEAVMVWLHGGSFETGQGAAYDGTDLASRGVVVVTLNYRLGPLGFLSTGDGSSTGNYGLMDQRLALQWVKDNIAEVGGDPTKVTLFGHDVGGNSILQHLVMSESSDLFSRAILQSISSSYPMKSVNNVVHADALAAAVGCVESEYVDCLRALPLYDLMNGQVQVKSGHHETLVWGPVTTFGTQTLQEVQGDEHDLVVGFSSSDGSGVVDRLGQGPLSREAWEAYSGPFVAGGKGHRSTHGGSDEQGILLQAALDHEYLVPIDGNSTDGMLRLQQAVDLNTDSRYVLPTVLLLRQVASLAQSVRLYVFDHHTSSVNGYPSWLTGAPHGSILPYVWGKTGNDSSWSTDEGALSDVIMTYWTNFAKYGSPNQNSAVAWPEYEEASQKYLHLQVPDIVARQAYRTPKVDFWLNWLPELTEFISQCDAEETDECEGVVVGGTVGITASEAGDVILVLLIVLAVLGLLCIVLLTTTCGYRERSKSLSHTLTGDTEMALKSWGNASSSLPSTIAVSVPFPMDDLPLPPPPPALIDTDDTKPLIPESQTPSESQEEEADYENINDDEEVRQALDHIDAVVDNAETASVDLGDGGQPSDDQKPKIDEEKEREPENKEPALEDEVPKNEEPTVEDDVPVPQEDEVPAS